MVEKKKKRMFAIIGSVIFCVFVIGAFLLGRNSKNDDITRNMNSVGTPSDINIIGISPNDPADDSSIDVAPIESQTDEFNLRDYREIELTIIGEKPDIPELPDTAFIWGEDEEVTLDDVQAYEELDPALKNPDIMPDITPEPIQTVKDDEIPFGTINDKNEIYVPNFGWIPHGGENVGIVHAPVNEEDWNWEQVGSMN
jgi:hypothetical protein